MVATGVSVDRHHRGHDRRVREEIEQADGFPEERRNQFYAARALRRHVTEGEWEDIKTGMPKELASVLPGIG
jgi:hypothetical protein